MLLYHGTSAENYAAILKEGFGHTPNTTWYCSAPNVVYFWHPEALAESDGVEDETDDYKREYAIRHAAESAHITAAANLSQADHVIIIEYESDDAEIEDDDSCENMAERGARYIRTDEMKLSNIKRVFSSPFRPYLTPFYLTGVIANDYFNTHSIPADLLSAVELIAESDSYRVWETLLDDAQDFQEVPRLTIAA